MSAKSIILAGLLTLASTATARADIDCGSINAAWNSAAIVRQLQTPTDDQAYQRNLIRLEALVNAMNEPINPLEGAERRDQSRIANYVVTLEAGLAAAQSGRRAMANRLFSDSLNPAFVRSLDTIDEMGECTQPEFDASFQSDQFMAETPMAGTDDIREIKLTPGSLAGSGEGFAGKENPMLALDEYQGPRFHSGILFKGDLIVFFGLLVSLLIIPAFIYWRRWSVSYQKREARRVLHSSAPVLVGQTRQDMIIVDISMNGMKLNHAGAIDKHRQLNVQLAGRWVLGHIRWQNASFAGIQFDRPIDPTTLNTVLNP